MSRWFAIAAVPLVAFGFSFVSSTGSATQQPPATSTLQPPVAVPAPAESLDGTWELVSLIEEGKVIPLETVKQTMMKDARIIVKGPTIAIVRPDGTVRTLAFVTDTKASPKSVDLAGEMQIGGKGIYMLNPIRNVRC